MRLAFVQHTKWGAAPWFFGLHNVIQTGPVGHILSTCCQRAGWLAVWHCYKTATQPRSILL
jgi:hypothetical protein